jgi:large repetitive protein
MLRVIACTSILIALLVVVLSSFASAQSVNINYTDRGWYFEDGFHDPQNRNYLVGDYHLGCVDYCGNFHNFFVFDLAGISQSIEAAKLAIYVPRIWGYDSNDPSETYALQDIVTPINEVMQGGYFKGSIYADLGSGVVYGNREMTAADMETVIEITLNPSAIAAMNSTHGLFALGGLITSLDAAANNETVFGNSNYFGEGTTELRLTLVPEPSTLCLCLAGIFATQLLRNRGRF